MTTVKVVHLNFLLKIKIQIVLSQKIVFQSPILAHYEDLAYFQNSTTMFNFGLTSNQSYEIALHLTTFDPPKYKLNNLTDINMQMRNINTQQLAESIGGGEIGLCCNSKSQDVDPNDVRASDVLNEERQQMAKTNRQH